MFRPYYVRVLGYRTSCLSHAQVGTRVSPEYINSNTYYPGLRSEGTVVVGFGLVSPSCLSGSFGMALKTPVTLRLCTGLPKEGGRRLCTARALCVEVARCLPTVFPRCKARRGLVVRLGLRDGCFICVLQSLSGQSEELERGRGWSGKLWQESLSRLGTAQRTCGPRNWLMTCSILVVLWCQRSW